MFQHSCLNFLQSSFPTYLHVNSICWNVVFSLNCFWNLEFAQGNNFLPNIHVRQIMIPLVMFPITYIICVYASDRSWKMTVFTTAGRCTCIWNIQWTVYLNNQWMAHPLQLFIQIDCPLGLTGGNNRAGSVSCIVGPMIGFE